MKSILPKKFVSVVKFNDTVYLLGVSDQSVNLIDKLDSNSLVEAEETESSTEKPNFLQINKAAKNETKYIVWINISILFCVSAYYHAVISSKISVFLTSILFLIKFL